MEENSICQIDFFADNPPSIEEIKEFDRLVNSSEINKLSFARQLQENMDKTTPESFLMTGIGLFILGRYAEALERLNKGSDCRQKFLYLTFVYRQLCIYEQALESLQRSLEQGADQLNITFEKVKTYRCAGNIEKAEKELEKCSNFNGVSAEYHYQTGRLYESKGLWSEAIGQYEKAVELAPKHEKALFRLAYRSDLQGDDETAIRYYLRIASYPMVSVNALLNLAVLYEDRSEYDKASQCLDKILKFHPNCQRAILFKKDVESSKTMIYDEEKEKKKDQKTQILEIPISDFELSVRSRNCFRKMNIRTLGDLMHITEAELLSYKNFGETSLREIKSILASKGLRLGMAVEERQFAAKEPVTYAAGEGEDSGIMGKSVDELHLPVRAHKCLQKLGIHTIGDLTARTEAELLGCKNFGITSLNEIKKILSNMGLSLRSLD